MTVFITGVNRGIGAQLSQLMASDGQSMIGTARDGSQAIQLDVTSSKDQAAMAEKLRGTPIDLLVCNAGVYLDKGQPLDTGYPVDIWAQTFAANVTGVFLTVQGLLLNLRAAPGAKIAIISSQMASHERAPGGSYIYRASKAAVLNVSRNLAADLRGEGIAVGIYHPGWVQTDMGGTSADITPSEAAQGLVQRFNALSMETTGCFETWDGRTHPY